MIFLNVRLDLQLWVATINLVTQCLSAFTGGYIYILSTDVSLLNVNFCNQAEASFVVLRFAFITNNLCVNGYPIVYSNMVFHIHEYNVSIHAKHELKAVSHLDFRCDISIWVSI